MNDAKLDFNLRSRLAETAGAEGRHPVVVSFRQRLSEEEAAALGLSGGGSTATGMLDPAAIRRLADDENVIRISLVPESRPTNP
jgi:hypothetical protein